MLGESLHALRTPTPPHGTRKYLWSWVQQARGPEGGNGAFPSSWGFQDDEPFGLLLLAVDLDGLARMAGAQQQQQVSQGQGGRPHGTARAV